MKARTDVKRNSILNHAGDLTPGHRVGARHRNSGMSPRGGGYPDNSTYSEISKGENKTADIILAELQKMGLRDDLLSVAEKVGADKFIQVWQFLDCHYDARDEGRFRVSFPGFDKYMKYQRNEFIREKASQGIAPSVIWEELKIKGCYLSLRSVERLSKRFRIDLVCSN